MVAKIAVIVQRLEQQVKKRKHACLVYGENEEIKKHYSKWFIRSCGSSLTLEDRKFEAD